MYSFVNKYINKSTIHSYYFMNIPQKYFNLYADSLSDFSITSLEESDSKHVDVFKYIKKDDLKKDVISKTLHNACFLCFLLIKFNKINNDEVLSDSGLIHKMSHYMISEKNENIQEILNMYNNFAYKYNNISFK